ncbi:TauD/TfdA family dioxygenase [Xenorhabdus bovienii]|nr:TauD/TfdA family dioxygenase [Xenorhabdus bovienii]
MIKNSKQIMHVALSPGDALILNNRICLHGRSAISDTAKFDGTDRWLVRIYGYKENSTAFRSCIQPVDWPSIIELTLDECANDLVMHFN